VFCGGSAFSTTSSSLFHRLQPRACYSTPQELPKKQSETCGGSVNQLFKYTIQSYLLHRSCVVIMIHYISAKVFQKSYSSSVIDSSLSSTASETPVFVLWLESLGKSWRTLHAYNYNTSPRPTANAPTSPIIPPACILPLLAAPLYGATAGALVACTCPSEI